MNNLPLNDFGNLISICPYCNAHIVNQFQVIDLYVYLLSNRRNFALDIRRVISKKPEYELYIKTLLINSLNKKPMLSRIVLTRPYGHVIRELKSTGFLTETDLKGIDLNSIF